MTQTATVTPDINRALMSKARDLQREFTRLIQGLGTSHDLLLARQRIEEATALIIKHLKK